MSREAEFTCKVSGGRIPASVAAKIAEVVRRMDGKTLRFSIGEVKRKRSNNQNSYMWGVVIEHITQAFRDAGNPVDKDDVYAFLKAHVWKLSQVFVTCEGEVLRGPGSTRHLSTTEMEARLEEARAWAAEVLGISVPLPNEIINDNEGEAA